MKDYQSISGIIIEIINLFTAHEMIYLKKSSTFVQNGALNII